MTYPTPAQCKAYMAISGAGEDTAITQILDGIITEIEIITNRTFVSQAATRSFGDEAPTITKLGRVLTFHEDLVSVTTLTNGNGTVIAATNYDLVPPSGPPYYQLILRPMATERFSVGADGTRITLNGSWGTTAACPKDITLAILELVNLSHKGRADGPAPIIEKGMIIDKSHWPDRIIRIIDSRTRS